jgi:hypothetical protein
MMNKEIVPHNNEYYMIDFHKKIKDTMKKCTYTYLGFKCKNKQYVVNVEIEYINYYINGSKMDRDTYDSFTIIDSLGEQINNSIYYDIVLQQIIKEFKNYVWCRNNFKTHEFFFDFYRTMLINYYAFIKNGMKYTLTKKDFEGQEYLISMLEDISIIKIIK